MLIWAAEYVDWHNRRHHHSGLGGYTPEPVLTGEHHAIAAERHAALDAQYQAHPERFVRDHPQAAMPPETGTINPLDPEPASSGAGAGQVRFPTLNRAQCNQPRSTLTEA